MRLITRLTAAVLFLVCTILAMPPVSFAVDKFKPGCTLPFDAIKKHHTIDTACGPDGMGNTDAKRAENRAKNNLCASGAPALLSYADFLKLEQAAEQTGISFGSPSHPPKDRSLLLHLFKTDADVTVGEGNLVRYAAYMIEAHVSNEDSGGESVNCNKNGKVYNDIHIALAKSDQDDDPCDSIVVEISPHFRPQSWTADNLNKYRTHPFRFTGHLFFDSSHKPCEPGKHRKPPRASVWEIHPVYDVEICRSKVPAECDVTNDSNWAKFDEWVGQGGEQ